MRYRKVSVFRLVIVVKGMQFKRSGCCKMYSRRCSSIQSVGFSQWWRAHHLGRLPKASSSFDHLDVRPPVESFPKIFVACRVIISFSGTAVFPFPFFFLPLHGHLLHSETLYGRGTLASKRLPSRCDDHRKVIGPHHQPLFTHTVVSSSSASLKQLSRGDHLSIIL